MEEGEIARYQVMLDPCRYVLGCRQCLVAKQGSHVNGLNVNGFKRERFQT